jgi:hypothetical protein
MSKSKLLILGGIILAILIIVALIFFAQQKSKTNSLPVVKNLKPHVYKDSAADISRISLKVFYVVPANQTAESDWQENIRITLSQIIRFHNVQFHNSSSIHASLYQSPVILEHDDSFYDTNNTANGNPEGLRNIVPELEKRYAGFLQTDGTDYQVVAIVYEGVGASGSNGAMILSYSYLSKPEYKLDGASIFYHEFAHTIGIPDRFNFSDNAALSDDIMGSGRYKPLASQYLGPDILAELGIGK